ncbi:MAG: TIGR02266 family protein [Deltaproteobacteria bacterium]|nr:TIGR02266 family protein [Deltaproteobacteria bacterium]
MSTDESRQHARTPIELKVEYRKLNTFLFDYTRNISKGGTFINTTKPLPVGTEFVFCMLVPQLEDPLELRGRVMWVIDEQDADPTKGTEPGMGIQFVYASEDERLEIEQAVQSLVTEQLGERAYHKLMGDES